MTRRLTSLALATALLFAITLSGPTLAAPAPDDLVPLSLGGPDPLADCAEVEPNNVPDSASPIALSGSCTGSAAATDPHGGWFVNYPDNSSHFVHDYWRVTLGATTQINVTLSFTAGANLDLVVTNDAFTVFRGFSLSTTGTLEQVATASLPAGQYLIAVLAISGSSAYTLSVTPPGGGSFPGAPSNLSATATSTTQIQLSWTDASTNETEFRVERKSSGGSFADIGSTGAGVTTFTSTGLTPATAYTFRVKARNSTGDSGYSNEASATTFSNASGCTADATTLCLSNSRFRVRVAWATQDGQSGAGNAVPLTSDTGYFTFFSATNVELVIKVLNACFPPFNNYWVFAGGLTDVQVVITVTDTQTGAVQTYVNPQKTPFAPLQDTAHFKTSCP